MTVGIVAALTFFTVFLAIYGLGMPHKTISLGEETDFFASRQGVITAEETKPNFFDRFVRPMLRNFLPQSPLSNKLSDKEHSKLTELLVRSGNPWGIRPEEYRGAQYLFTLIGLVVAVIFVALDNMFGLIPLIPAYIFLLLFPLMGYVIPFSIHNTAREERAQEVQKQLPEGLDLIVVSLSSGQNFEPALAQVTPKMSEGLLKEEFTRVNKELHAGQSLNVALTSFARRASSDDTEGFAKSILQAQQLGADVTDTLKAQARTARAAYEARLEKKIASLSSRMFIFLIPTMLPAVLLIFLAPSLSQLGGSGLL